MYFDYLVVILPGPERDMYFRNIYGKTIFNLIKKRKSAKILIPKGKNTLEDLLIIKKKIEEEDYKKMFIVTSYYHVKRVDLLANTLGIKNYKIIPCPTDTNKYKKFISEGVSTFFMKILGIRIWEILKNGPLKYSVNKYKQVTYY